VKRTMILGAGEDEVGIPSFVALVSWWTVGEPLDTTVLIGS